MKGWTGKGIAAKLIDQCIEHAKAADMHQVGLEVAVDNMRAIKLYEKRGFAPGKLNGPSIAMTLILKAAKP